MRKKVILGSCIGLGAFLVAVAIVYMVFFRADNPSVLPADSTSVATVTEVIYTDCQSASHRPTCYERALSSYLGPLDPTQAIDVIRQLRQLDSEYIFCHVAAHVVGEYAVSLDPENWIDVMAQGPTDGLCSFGFEHGAVLGRFNAEYLTGDALAYAVSELEHACEDRSRFQPTELRRAMCYHGLGHVLVHITGADVPTALSSCQQIARKSDGRDYTRVCFEGVYMQLFQPLEPEDYALIGRLEMEPDETNIQTFCERYSTTDDMFAVCWREAWPLVLKNDWDATELSTQCDIFANDTNSELCYQSGFTIHARHNLGNDAKLLQLCENMNASHQGECLGIAANAYIEEDPALVPNAVALCAQAADDSVGQQCWSFLARTAQFNYHPNTPERESFCQQLPQHYRAQCEAR